MNKKGFVASSILYSFLIVFVALIMTIIANYAHNRVLMNRISDDIKKEIETTNDNDISGAITPEIGSIFTPVRYDGSIWRVANSNNKNATWYNYRDKKWANAVLTTEIVDTTEGAEVSNDVIEKNGYVWIPRFRYQIFSSVKDNCIPYKNEEQTELLTSIPSINIIFEPEEGASGSQGEAIQTYRVPSAFTYYKTENTQKKPVFTKGFWVKKYPDKKENELILSASTSNGYCSYSVCFGGIPTNRNNHIIRNAQWGAVAYLTYSKYGLGTDTASDSTTGNETGVYHMNHEGENSGELIVYINEDKSVYPNENKNFYNDKLFPIDKKSENSWDGVYDSGDATCETNINPVSYSFSYEYWDVIFGMPNTKITSYYLMRGSDGIFSFNNNSYSNYYVRDVYETILN